MSATLASYTVVVPARLPTAAYDEHGWSHVAVEAGEAARRPWLPGLVPQVGQTAGERVEA